MKYGLASNKTLSSRFFSTGDVVVQEFSSSATWTCPIGVKEIFCMVVAGGGGAGSVAYLSNTGNYINTGAGGGGQVITASIAVTPGKTYAITVGAGGSGGGGSVAYRGANGGTSMFGSQVFAVGGGGGGGNSGDLVINNVDAYKRGTGATWGTGGGADPFHVAGTSVNPEACAGLGAGSGAAAGGANGNAVNNGAGGSGKTITAIAPSGRQPSVAKTWSCGGGGGAGKAWHTTVQNPGGIGGGGGGAYWTFASSIWTYNDPSDGTANTGGGAGSWGARYDTDNQGGSDTGKNGGSGVVCIVYERAPL